jgi:hypothetical protein
VSELADYISIREPSNSSSDIMSAVRYLKRTLRGRDIRDVRPTRSNWIVADSVGFSLEGKSRDLSRRKLHISGELRYLAHDTDCSSQQTRALVRVADLIDASRSHPTWLYWYSPQTIAIARRSSHDTLFEVNDVVARTIRTIGVHTSISSWEECIGVTSRRLPIGLVMASSPSGRSVRLIRKLERAGVLTLGGLTVISTDSLDFLASLQLSTLENFSRALRDGY